MNNLTIIGIAAVGIIVLTKGKIFSTLGELLGLGSRVADLGTSAIQGVGLILDVAEEGISVSAEWLGETYYFDESLNSEIISRFEEAGITGIDMLTVIKYVEAGKLEMFEGVVTRETCSSFFMKIVQDTAGHSQWNEFNAWANAQIAAILTL